MHPQGIESTIDKIFITATVDQQFTQKKTQHVQDIQFLSFSNIHDNVILILFITLTKYIYPLIKKMKKKNQPTIHSQLPILQEFDLVTDESMQNQMNNIEILLGCLETVKSNLQSRYKVLKRKLNDSTRRQANILCGALSTKTLANLAKCQVKYVGMV